MTQRGAVCSNTGAAKEEKIVKIYTNAALITMRQCVPNSKSCPWSAGLCRLSAGNEYENQAYFIGMFMNQ